MERVSDPAGLGQCHVEGAPIGAGEVQHAPVDALAPRLGLCEQPPGGTRSVATRDKVEQLTLGHVHDGGAPAPGAPGAAAPEQGLIKAERLHRADPITVRDDQRFAPGEHRPVRRVSVTTQLVGHIGDRRASRPTTTVAQRPDRAVNADRAGAIRSSTSVNDPTTQLAVGHRHRHLCHTRRTGRPNTGRSTNPTGTELSDHTAPPQPPHAGRARVRMCSASGPPGASLTPRTSTSPNPTINSQIRVGFSSTGGLLHRCLSTPILEARNPTIADPVPAHFRRAGKAAPLNAFAFPSAQELLGYSPGIPRTTDSPTVHLFREHIPSQLFIYSIVTAKSWRQVLHSELCTRVPQAYRRRNLTKVAPDCLKEILGNRLDVVGT